MTQSTGCNQSARVLDLLHPSSIIYKMFDLNFRSWSVIVTGLVAIILEVDCSRFVNADDFSRDVYHELHIPRNPPLHPTYSKVPKTSFTCEEKEWGYHADTEAQCQAYHLCQGVLIRSFLCPNATLFHNQFKICDQFYNVRCGVDVEYI